MSEIRSWDGSCRYTPEESGIFPKIECPGYSGIDDIPVRVVVWPEGAPKQEDVPQAGEKRIYMNKTYIISEGIPFNSYQNLGWRMRCLETKTKMASSIPLSSLKPIPPKPAQTYTEDEIRGALDLAERDYAISLVDNVADRLMARLKK